MRQRPNFWPQGLKTSGVNTEAIQNVASHTNTQFSKILQMTGWLLRI